MNGTGLFGSFERKISGSNGTSGKVFLFFRTECSKRKFVFHFFKAIFDTSFGPPQSFFGKWIWFALMVNAFQERTYWPWFLRTFRDWSKSIEGGGPEQREGGSWGFEPCARGGSCNFQLPLGGGSPYFLLSTNETVDYTCYIKHSQLELLLKCSETCCARKYKGWKLSLIHIWRCRRRG